jgi:SNW domain-containing protein 1
VQFEKQIEDPFGLDKFLTEAKKGKRGLDVIGQRSMIASSSGGGEGGSSRGRIDFESSKRHRNE